MTLRNLVTIVGFFVLMACGPAARAQAATGAETLPLAGERAEDFLATADVVEMRSLPVGITRPRKVTLRDGERTAHAVWKTVDKFKLRQRFSDGRMETAFRDTYKHEIAAYELDKLLGLGLVPPTVERRIGDDTGSLQLWIEEAITESDRMKAEIRPPDLERWNDRMFAVRLLHQLTDDSDSRNVRNLLIDPDFRLYAIDFSRAFRLHHKLRRESALRRFPRSALERMRDLTPELLGEKLGRWLTKAQIEALLERRDRILDLAERLVAEHGETAVLFR